MDGIEKRGQVIVIGSTNRIDSIDPALRRPGRFDREFYFDLPNRKARLQILEIHTKKWNLTNTQILEELADLTSGFCGADLKHLCVETALLSFRRQFPHLYSHQMFDNFNNNINNNNNINFKSLQQLHFNPIRF